MRCPFCYSLAVVCVSPGLIECPQRVVGMAPPYSAPTPVTQGCGSRFSEADAAAAQDRWQQHCRDEQRRMAEKRDAERGYVEACDALERAVEPRDIVALLCQVAVEKPSFRNETRGARARALKQAWPNLIRAGATGEADAEIICVRLSRNFVTPTAEEEWRRRGWHCEVNGGLGWLDERGTVWHLGDVTRGRSWESPRKGLSMCFKLAPGTALGSPLVRRVRGEGGPPRWDWELPQATAVKAHTTDVYVDDVLVRLADVVLSVIARTNPIPPGRRDRLREALQTIADSDTDVLHAAVLDLGEHAKPELRALTAITGPGCPARRQRSRRSRHTPAC